MGIVEEEGAAKFFIWCNHLGKLISPSNRNAIVQQKGRGDYFLPSAILGRCTMHTKGVQKKYVHLLYTRVYKLVPTFI